MMRKKALTIFLTLGIFCCAVLSACDAETSARSDGAAERLDRMGRVFEEDGWTKEAMTEVTPVTYEDDDGNTVVYYVCKTTYYEAEPMPEGLNTDAFSGILDPETADSERACGVNGSAAALYAKGERAYLCWTDTPEYTFVLEYDPKAVTEEEIFRWAESVLPAGE